MFSHIVRGWLCMEISVDRIQRWLVYRPLIPAGSFLLLETLTIHVPGKLQYCAMTLIYVFHETFHVASSLDGKLEVHQSLKKLNLSLCRYQDTSKLWGQKRDRNNYLQFAETNLNACRLNTNVIQMQSNLQPGVKVVLISCQCYYHNLHYSILVTSFWLYAFLKKHIYIYIDISMICMDQNEIRTLLIMWNLTKPSKSS